MRGHSPLQKNPNGKIIPKSRYSTGEIAELIEISRKTAQRWVDSATLRGYRDPGSPDRPPPPPRPEQTKGTREGAAWARAAHRERRVRHEALMAFCREHAPSFDYVIMKFANTHAPPKPVEHLIKMRQGRAASVPASSSKPSTQQTSTED